jgi:hypothetical protein
LVKLASILAAVYLAVSPAMSVGRLVHALELCPLFQNELSNESCQGHDHEPAPDNEHSHGDCHRLNIESGAIPMIPSSPDVEDAPRFLLPAPLLVARADAGQPAEQIPERPPPLAPHIPTTRLLI